jgi:diphthamide biosynthesis methyltransferase
MPRTPYFYFLDNHKIGAHTLFLLDLKPDKNEYLKINQALTFLIDIQKVIKENEEMEERDLFHITEKSEAIILSRVGFEEEKIVYGEIKDLIKMDLENTFQPPLCLIIPGDLNEIEEKYLKKFTL